MIIAISIVPLVGYPDRALCQSGPSDKDVVSATLKMGLAIGQSFRAAVRTQTTGPTPTDQYAKDLKTTLDHYNLCLRGQRGSVQVLNSIGDVVITGSVVASGASGGASLVAAAATKFVKDAALGQFQTFLENDCKKDFASRLNTIGPNWDRIKSLPSDTEKLTALKQLGVLADARSALVGDDGALKLVDGEILHVLAASDIATLEEIRGQSNDINTLRQTTNAELGAMSHQFSEYVRQTQKGLDDLIAQQNMAQDSLDEANKVVEKLHSEVENNTQQLVAISDVVFSQADSRARLEMLNAGYLTDTIPEDQRKQLIKTTEAQVQRDKVIAGVNDAVSQVNKIGQIAQNLKLFAPPFDADFNEAVTVADTAGKVFSQAYTGDILGAVASFTGLFGGGTDPTQARFNELTSLMKNEFDQVNQKLDTVIENEQQLAEGISDLSKQISQYDKDTMDRFDLVQFSLDSIQGDVQNILYGPMTNCISAESALKTNLNVENLAFVTIEDAKKAHDNTYFSSIVGCVTYLQGLYDTAFKPGHLLNGSLALRLSAGTTQSSFQIPQAQQDTYSTNRAVKELLKTYSDTWAFFKDGLNSSLGGHLAGGVNSLTLPAAITSLSMPSQNVWTLAKKLEILETPSPSCTSASAVSIPLIQIVCGYGNPTAAYSLPDELDQVKEEKANSLAKQLMEVPITQDPLKELTHYSLLFAPVWDFTDVANASPAGGTVFPDLAKWASQTYLVPWGRNLLEGNLQAITVGLAQVDMQYGDLTSSMVFNTLWDSNVGAFTTQFSGRTASAKNLMANPYIARNVLMIALDRCSKLSGDGQKYAYEFAIDEASGDGYEPFGQLEEVFGKQFAFHSGSWESINVSSGGSPIKPLRDAQGNQISNDCSLPGNQNGIDCTRRVHATIAGAEITMPTAEEFAQRRLYYPPIVAELETLRDELAVRVTNYRVLDAVVGSLPVGQRLTRQKQLAAMFVDILAQN